MYLGDNTNMMFEAVNGQQSAMKWFLGGNDNRQVQPKVTKLTSEFDQTDERQHDESKSENLMNDN